MVRIIDCVVGIEGGVEVQIVNTDTQEIRGLQFAFNEFTDENDLKAKVKSRLDRASDADVARKDLLHDKLRGVDIDV